MLPGDHKKKKKKQGYRKVRVPQIKRGGKVKGGEVKEEGGRGRGLCRCGVKAVLDFHTLPFVPSVYWGVCVCVCQRLCQHFERFKHSDII